MKSELLQEIDLTNGQRIHLLFSKGKPVSVCLYSAPTESGRIACAQGHIEIAAWGALVDAVSRT